MTDLTTAEKQSGVGYRVRCKDGSWRWHTTNASPIIDEGGNIISFVGLSHDINERKCYEQWILEMATHDALTNLPNRTLFYDRFDIARATAARNRK